MVRIYLIHRIETYPQKDTSATPFVSTSMASLTSYMCTFSRGAGSVPTSSMAIGSRSSFSNTLLRRILSMASHCDDVGVRACRIVTKSVFAHDTQMFVHLPPLSRAHTGFRRLRSSAQMERMFRHMLPRGVCPVLVCIHGLGKVERRRLRIIWMCTYSRSKFGVSIAPFWLDSNFLEPLGYSMDPWSACLRTEMGTPYRIFVCSPIENFHI